MRKEVVPPSTKWRSMSVRTDIVLDGNDRRGVREITRGTRGVLPRRQRAARLCASTRLHDFVFCVSI